MAADSTTRAGPFSTVGVDAVDLGRYDAIVLEDGDVLLVYDRSDPNRWIQSDQSLSLEDRR